MQCLSPVKEIHQDILALSSSTQAFLCSFSPTAGAGTFRQVWRTWSCRSKARNRWKLFLFNRKKIFLAETGVSLSHWLLCLYQHLSSGREKMAGEKGQRKPVWSILFWNCKDTHQTRVFWEPEAVSSHCLATCSSSTSFSPVLSVAYMGPALEEFGLGFRYSSPPCDSACHFLGHSNGNVSKRELIIANLIVVRATFNSYWDQLVALIVGNSLMACRWSPWSLSYIAKNFLPITCQLLGTSGMQHKHLLYPVFSGW